ncbi:MAG: DUF4238 domain-containing protein [Chlorobiales bacterium]|nr:DUF4238 domain-containing protein [Chlorobiales bacterium]
MKKKSIARQHHYLPQVYLKAFTHTGLKNGKFYVFDVHNGDHFRTSPKNVAVERDFNRVDIEGHSPDVIEHDLSDLENKAAMAIQSVIESEEFPNDDDYTLILNIITLFVVRNPKLRKSANHFHEQMIHRIGDILVSDKSIWEYHVKKARESGNVVSDDVSHDDMKHFIKNREYKIEFPIEGNLHDEFRLFDILLPILGQRTWSVLVAPKDGPEFICSDHPATLFPKFGKYSPIGYGSKETEVFVPLGRRIGFYGVFETPLLPVIKLNPGQVATMNMRVKMNAERHVFSALPSFFIWREGQVREVHCGSNPKV